MDLKYFQNCPSCGAPIELAEADRLIQCPFCDVKNYMVSEGPLRFVLPEKLPEHVEPRDIIHVPYLRFKGHIYSCLGQKMEHKIVDATHLGVGGEKLPATLGLRPQAMKLSLASVDQDGRFVKLTEKLATVFSKAAMLTTAFSDDRKSLYHRSFIGETISFIYLPTYFKDGWFFDAVLNRKITDDLSVGQLCKKTLPFSQKWHPKFISTICPHCADVMTGTHDSLVLTCRNCDSCWHERKGKFVKVEWSILPSEKRDSLFLPFWRISSDVKGVQLNSFGDFLRLTNQPVVIREAHEKMEHSLWVPAFKIRPKYFLHMAKNLTVSQMRLPLGKKEMAKNLYPVTMPLSEALQAQKVVLAYSVMNKRKFFPQLPTVSLDAKRTVLVYLPFCEIGHDLVQDQTSVTVARSVLNFGRTM